MFCKSVVDSDAFLDMPLTAQCLYFHLGMHADDDGFVNNSNKIRRAIGANVDDFTTLEKNLFLINFPSGVTVIRHWKVNNYIPKDRYKPTRNTAERCMLVCDEGVYSLGESTQTADCMQPVYGLDTNCIQPVYNLDTQVRLGKDRLGKVSIEQVINTASNQQQPTNVVGCYQEIMENYNQVCVNLTPCKTMTKKRCALVDNFMEIFTLVDWQVICEFANANPFFAGQNKKGWKGTLEHLLMPDHATAILEHGNATGAQALDDWEQSWLEEVAQRKRERETAQ